MTQVAYLRPIAGNAADLFIRRVLPLAVASCFAVPAWANPGGASVAAGAATFAADGKTLNVTNAPGTIINWQQFSIRPDEITRFIQQGASSAVLNRVTGGDPSQILGQLLSNGRVFLINPAGVTIGAGATIDTAGFIASTLNITDGDFLSGRMKFSAVGAAGKVENHGTIRANGGPVYLIAPTVENHGVIRADNGDILLAAGKRVEIVAGASPHLRVEIDNAEGAEALNVGELVGRSVNLYGTALRNAGTVQATRVEVGEGGSIFLRAAKDVTLEQASRLDASGTKGGTITVQAESGTLLAQGRIDATGSAGKGGEVKLLGDRVALLDGARVDASGTSGGGSVLVGGDYQGANAAVQNASRTYVDANATIKADAVESGDGGKVVVWSNEATGFYGQASAKGGAGGGDGGFVEVSGKQYLDYQGFVDTTAAMGATGTLLLDPSDIRITTTADAFAGGAFSGGAPRVFTGANGTATITWGTINTQLGASNVIINTGGTGGFGDITVVDASPVLARNNALWLVANRNITVNGSITNTGTGALGLYAGWNGAAFTFPTAPVVTAGTGTIALNQNVTLTSGAFTASAGSNISGAGAITTTGGNNQAGGAVTITSSGGTVNLSGAITTNGGVRSSNGAGTAGGAVAVTGSSVALGAVNARGGNGQGGNFAGGTGGAVTLVANGAAGSVLALNGALDTRGGDSVGTGNTGSGGAVTLRAGAGGTITGNAGATITTTGGRGQTGGNVLITSSGTNATVNLQGAIATTGGTAATNAAGKNAGTITINNSTAITTAALTARGTAAGGGNSVGGNGGAIAITSAAGAGSGIQLTGAIDTTGGDSTGTGNTGNGGAVTLTGAAGGTIAGNGGASITTTGGRGQTGGNVTITAAGGNAATVNLQGAITTSGGTAATNVAGKNAGTVAVSNATAVTLAGPITARGSNAGGGNTAGGSGGAVNLDAAGASPTLSIGGAIDTRGGDSAGTGTGGTGGNVRLRTANGGTITDTATINTSGGRGQNAGTVTVTTITPATDTLTSVSLQGAITAAGGTGVATGFSGGAVTIANATQVQVAAINTQGSNAVGANQVGGSGGAVAITTRNAGNAITLNGAIDTRGGDSTGTGNTGSGGAVTLTGAAGGSITGNAASTITTTGGRGQTGGNVTLTAAGGNLATINLQGAITANGGTAATGLGGKNAGAVAVSNATAVTLAGAITARGSNADAAANAAGGTGGAVNVDATGTTPSIVLNGAIDTRGGNSVGATAVGGTGGNVRLRTANGGSISDTATINTSGGRGQNAGTVTVTGIAGTDTLASISLGAITATGGTGVVAGQNGGAVSITNATAITLAGISTAGSDAATANNIGGSGGAVAITARGTPTPTIQLNGDIDTHGGNSAGTPVTAAPWGTPGGVTIRTSAGGSVTSGAIAINTSGGRSQAGGNVLVSGIVAADTLASVDLRNATIATNAGNGHAAGLNAGSVTISQATQIRTGTITAIGGNAAAGSNAVGGNGGAVVLTNVGAGSLIDLAGAITTTGGNSDGTGNTGNGGAVTLTGAAGGTIVGSAGATITTTGGRGQTGGNVLVSSSGTNATVNLQGAITTSGGTAATGLGGKNAGTITINNSTAISTAALTARGSASGGGNAVGGNGNTIAITASGAGNAIQLTGAVDTRGGDSTGTGNTGNGGNVTLTGSAGGTVSGNAGATITTTGGRGQTGGNVTVTSAGGNAAAVNLQGAITTSGGTAATGLGGKAAGTVTVNNTGTAAVGAITAQGSNAATGVGGAGGAVSLTATTSTTLRGNVTTTGGTGTTTGGAGANVTVNGPSVLGASITVDTRGGTGPTAGASGAVLFNGNMTSSPAGNDLTVFSGANTIRFAGSVTDVRQLTTTSTAAAGTRFDGNVDTADVAGNGIRVNGNVTVGGNVTLTTDNAANDGNIAITGTTNADAAASLRQLTLNAGDGTLDNGSGGALAAIGGTQAFASFGAIGSTVRLGNVTATAGAPGGVLIEADDLASLGNVAMTGTLTVRPHSAATNMRVGGAGAFAGLDLSGARLAAITGYNALVAGAAAGQGTLGIGSGLPSFASGVNVTLQSGGAGGTVSIANPLTTTGTGTLTVNAGTGGATLGANVTVGGAASLASTGNGIVQTTGSFVAPGTTTLNATGANNDVTLAQAGNDFGTVTVIAGRNVTLRDANSLALGTSNLSGTLSARTALDITLNGTQTAATGLLLEAGRNFINTAGAAALDPGTGRWLVYSTNPASDTRGGLVYAFKQYNAPIGTAPLGTGNGFLYSVAPVVTPSLVPTVSKVYDGTTAATLTAANYAVAGAIDGDVVTLNNPVAGTYDTKNVGTSKTVSVNGIAIAGASNGAATVYGYQLGSTTASGNVGTITARPITVSSDAGQGKVYGTNDPAAAATAYSVTSGSVVTGDTLSGSMGRVGGENVGSYAFTQNTVAIADGNGGNNYTLTFNGSANPFAVTPGSVTASIANQAKAYGANDPAVGGIAVVLTGLVNATVTDINGNSTLINDGALTSTVTALTRAAGENVGSHAITAGTFAAPSANYNAPSFTGTPSLSVTPASVTASIANQSKIYGDDDPALGGIPATLTGLVNRTVSTWNGNVLVDDSALTSSVTGLTRNPGENVGSYAVTTGTFTAPSANYNAPSFTGTPNLVISPASLTASIANQAKSYGDDDPVLAGIGVTLGGLVNRTVSTWNGNVVVNDSALASTATALTRAAGENVGSYAITAGTFTTPSANYNAPSFTGAPDLAINPASLTASIASQSKVYGGDDPALGGIPATLTGLVNRTVSTWNGNVVVDDSALTSAVTALTRNAGENVGSYAITAGTFTAPSANYNAPSFTGTPFLSITPASLTASIANQAKIYGDDDPALAGIGVTLGGLVNRTVSTWNGNVVIDDSALASSVTALTRNVGENVGTYAITAGTFAAPNGNYNAPSFTGAPDLAINPADLAASIASQAKVYGADDPALAGIGVTLAGLVNRTVSTWNGSVVVDDSALTSSVTGLTRTPGENVGSYAITAGTFTAPGANYNAPVFGGSPTLDIAQASLSASIASQSKVYGTPDPAPGSIPVSLSGLVNRTVATWNGPVAVDDTGLVGATLASLARVPGENVGAYAYTSGVLNPLTGSSAGNYAGVFLPGASVLDITPAALVIAANNANRFYGEPNPPFSATFTGLANGDTPAAITGLTLTTPATVASNVGAYAITPSGGVNPNYTIVYSAGMLNIVASPLTVRADDAARLFGEPNPPFTATYTGFKLGQGPADLFGTLTFSTPAVPDSSPGPYPISPSGVSALNYAVTFVNGTLTVQSAEPGNAESARDVATSRAATTPRLPRIEGGCATERDDPRTIELAPGLCVRRTAGQ